MKKPEINLNTLMIVLLPILGVVTGAFIQHYSSVQVEQQKTCKTLAAEAYTDYIKFTELYNRIRDE